MEENFEEQTAGSRGNFSRTLVGHAHQGICIACLVNANRGRFILPRFLAPYTTHAHFVACYFVSQSLSHFGLVDSLAPATAMHEFVEYTQNLERKEAEECFAALYANIPPERIRLQIIYDKKAWEKLLQSLQNDFHEICVLE